MATGRLLPPVGGGSGLLAAPTVAFIVCVSEEMLPEDVVTGLEKRTVTVSVYSCSNSPLASIACLTLSFGSVKVLNDWVLLSTLL
ncbi:hypothetical protein D3C71_1667250 [compost metagenome]